MQQSETAEDRPSETASDGWSVAAYLRVCKQLCTLAHVFFRQSRVTVNWHSELCACDQFTRTREYPKRVRKPIHLAYVFDEISFLIASKSTQYFRVG